MYNCSLLWDLHRGAAQLAPHTRKQACALSQPGVPAGQSLLSFVFLSASQASRASTKPYPLLRSTYIASHSLQSSLSNAEARELAVNRRPHQLKLKPLDQLLNFSFLTCKMGKIQYLPWGTILQLKCINIERAARKLFCMESDLGATLLAERQ